MTIPFPDQDVIYFIFTLYFLGMHQWKVRNDVDEELGGQQVCYIKVEKEIGI